MLEERDESNRWRISDINGNYEVCKSYPSVIVVPSNSDNELISNVAKYRSKNRLPVLTWLSKSGIALCRSSQPSIGVRLTNSKDDVKYLSNIKDSNQFCNSSIFIVDARPEVLLTILV